MNATKTKHNWATFLQFYSDQYKGRKTRLGFFENAGDVVQDYWIEDGMPLLGIEVALTDELPTIELMLNTYSHSVSNVRNLTIHLSLEGDEDGIDIIGNDGKTTILRFEKD